MMAVQRDAKLNDMIRLKQVPPAPLERWRMVPTLRSTTPSKSSLPHRPTSPLHPRSTNIQGMSPEHHSRIAIKYRKSPCLGRTPKTPSTSMSPQRSSKTPKSTGKKTPRGKSGYTPSSCRYIPSRVTTDMEYSSFLLQQQHGRKDDVKEAEVGVGGEDDGVGNVTAAGAADVDSPNKVEYQRALLHALINNRGDQRQRGVLSFRVNTPSRHSSSLIDYSEGCEVGGSLCMSHSRVSHNSAKQLTLSPEKILDAPTLVNDYYLNNLDWGKSNQVAIGLGAGVYLWNASTGSVNMLMEMEGVDEGDYVSSVSWSNNGKFLAIGGSNAVIQLWDVAKEKKIRSMRGHVERVGALTWNKHTLTSASRDGMIVCNDVRKAEPVICSSHFHKMEVCGLQWSQDGSTLASGGNDNLVCIWNNKTLSQPVHILNAHQSAVKAIAWCPWKPNMLVTGGGSRDRTIRFWNSFTGECMDTIDTKAPVSALAWNKDHRQLISAHGCPENHMIVWQYPTFKKLRQLSGHSDRVLHMCLSPRRGRVASIAGDETLRIWKCFERLKQDVSQRSYSEESITALLHSFN